MGLTPGLQFPESEPGRKCGPGAARTGRAPAERGARRETLGARRSRGEAPTGSGLFFPGGEENGKRWGENQDGQGQPKRGTALPGAGPRTGRPIADTGAGPSHTIMAPGHARQPPKRRGAAEKVLRRRKQGDRGRNAARRKTSAKPGSVPAGPFSRPEDGGPPKAGRSPAAFSGRRPIQKSAPPAGPPHSGGRRDKGRNHGGGAEPRRWMGKAMTRRPPPSAGGPRRGSSRKTPPVRPSGPGSRPAAAQRAHRLGAALPQTERRRSLRCMQLRPR